MTGDIACTQTHCIQQHVARTEIRLPHGDSVMYRSQEYVVCVVMMGRSLYSPDFGYQNQISIWQSCLGSRNKLLLIQSLHGCKEQLRSKTRVYGTQRILLLENIHVSGRPFFSADPRTNQCVLASHYTVLFVPQTRSS